MEKKKTTMKRSRALGIHCRRRYRVNRERVIVIAAKRTRHED